MNTTTKSNSKEFIEIPSNSTMAKDITSYKKNKFTTRDLAETSLLIALVFIATRFINIRLPLASTGGLVHLGNTMLFIAAIVFGKRKGAIAGAFGMGLFDLLSEWSGNKKGESIKTNIFAIIISGVWMIFGYYVTEMILYGNHAKAMLSIPGNITQIVIGLVIGVPIAKILRKYIKSNI